MLPSYSVLMMGAVGSTKLLPTVLHDHTSQKAFILTVMMLFIFCSQHEGGTFLWMGLMTLPPAWYHISEFRNYKELSCLFWKLMKQKFSKYWAV
jgi:hypothetical protein